MIDAYVYIHKSRDGWLSTFPVDGFIRRRFIVRAGENIDVLVYSRQLATSELFYHDLEYVGLEVDPNGEEKSVR